MTNNDLIDGTAEAAAIDTLRIDDAAGAIELRNIENIDRLLLNEAAAGFDVEIPTVMNDTADFIGGGTLGELKIESAVAMTHGITITTTVGISTTASSSSPARTWVERMLLTGRATRTSSMPAQVTTSSLATMAGTS